jgi:hypothetical protein
MMGGPYGRFHIPCLYFWTSLFSGVCQTRASEDAELNFLSDENAKMFKEKKL